MDTATKHAIEMTGEIADLKTALRKIKALVVGDALPNWDRGMRTTQTRGHIADLCDIALRQTDK